MRNGHQDDVRMDATAYVTELSFLHDIEPPAFPGCPQSWLRFPSLGRSPTGAQRLRDELNELTLAPPMAENLDRLGEDLETMDVEPVVLADEDGDILVEEEDDTALADDDEEVDDAPEKQEEDSKASETHDDSVTHLQAHSDSVYAVSMTRLQSSMLLCVTGGGDDVGKLTCGENCFDLRGHTDSVTCVGFSHTGALVATGSYDGTIRIWNAATGIHARSLEGPGDVEWLAWHPRGDVILAGAQDSTCWMWLATTGECLRVFVGHDGAVNCGLFTIDGNWIVTGSADATVKIWGPKKGTCRHTFKFGGPIVSLETHPADADLMIAAAENGTATIVHRKLERVVATLEHTSRSRHDAVAYDDGDIVTCAALCGGSNSWAASGALDGVCKIWDYGVSTPTVRHILSIHAAVVVLSWHPIEPRLYVASADAKIRNFDARTGDLLVVFAAGDQPILTMAVDYAQEEDTILAAGDDHIPRIFKAHVHSENGAFRLTK